MNHPERCCSIKDMQSDSAEVLVYLLPGADTMSAIIKPMIESRLQRAMADTTKLDRMRVREALKTARERQLLSIKTVALPDVKPSMKRDKDFKCEKCDVDKETFTEHIDWYLELVDALTMPLSARENSVGWLEWMNIPAMMMRRNLAKLMDALVINPAHIIMMKNIQLRKKTQPLVLVLKTESLQLDLEMIRFVFYIHEIKLPMMIHDNKFHNIPTKEVTDVTEAQLASHLKAMRNLLVVLDGDKEEDLSLILNACGFGMSMEVYLLPVSINYEKPQSKNLGIVKMNFHEPYAIKDLAVKKASEAQNLMAISKHLNYDIEIKRPVMSTNVIAFMLMTEFRDGASIKHLAEKLDELHKSHRNVDYAFEGKSEDVVEHAVELLGKDLLEINGDRVKPTSDRTKILQLSRYAEVLTPHFALESILVITTKALKRSEKFVDYNSLITEATDLCELLEHEIPLAKPCQDIQVLLKNAFDRLSIYDIIYKPKVQMMTSNEQRAQRMAHQFESSDSEADEGFQSRSPENEVNIGGEVQEVIKFINATKPVLEIYLTVACMLKKLIGNIRISQEDFIAMSLKAMSEECEDGNCKSWESCAVAWVKSSMKCFAHWNMIELNDDMINLHSDCDNAKSIKYLIKKIERFFDFA